jgi:DNA-binding XRE family transcriptional regulator
MADPAVRSARLAAGLSQGALAAAAGLSRQAVGAIEAGRHRPSVDAALALARVLDRSVEDLFAPGSPGARPVLGTGPAEGQAALAARVGSDVVFAPATAALAYAGWPRANASLLPGAGPRHVLALSGSSAAAVEAMTAGRAHAALVHGRADRLPPAPAGAARIHVARWRVGLATRSRRSRTLEELCARRVRVVQREDGAATQRAFLAAAAAAGQAAPPGPRASGHLEVARRVVEGAAAGVTMEPAARSYGLDFAELETHVAQLWIDGRRHDHPAVESLVGVLRSAAFTQRLALIGSYDTEGCGSQMGDAS